MPAVAEPRCARRNCRRHVIVVCTGEECRRRGAMALLDELKGWRANADSDLRISSSRCLGHCALAPAVMEDGEMLGAVTPRRLRVELSRLDQERA
ncbi:MAG: NAD(P)H-dependent oxidoreductase subunit E [Bryobacteraceae bacterium]